MTARSLIRYAHNGDAAIAYMESGSGIDLLVIGGFVSHLEIVPSLPAAQRFWDRMGSFARVILFDKRGMGLSDRDAGAYTLENVVDDALAVLDALDVPQSAIFGISEGGSAATMLAAAHPSLSGEFAQLWPRLVVLFHDIGYVGQPNQAAATGREWWVSAGGSRHFWLHTMR